MSASSARLCRVSTACSAGVCQSCWLRKNFSSRSEICACSILEGVGTALLMAYFGVCGLGVALYARRPDSRDITRLNAIEYRDERDKSLAAEGFAAVGVAALIIGFVSFIVMMLTQQMNWFVIGVFLALLVVWAAANSVAARRR